MKFYTNVAKSRNYLLLREVNNGERKSFRVKYKPTTYAVVGRKTNLRTLTGEYVTPISHLSINDANDWFEQYKDQKHLAYGSRGP